MSERSHVEKVLIHEVMLMAYQEGIEVGRKRALKEIEDGKQQTKRAKGRTGTGSQAE